MPLFYQHNINEHTKLAVWHIAENEAFFLEKVAIKNEITHPHKRLQHLAGRYLLQLLDAEFPLHLISISESKKPLLTNEKFHFSISHCGDYAAAIISENQTAGIDVEMVTPKIEFIKTKFLNESELALLDRKENIDGTRLILTDHQTITLFWSAKESVYKWHGKGALSFKRNMSMNQLSVKAEVRIQSDGDRQTEYGFINAHFIKDEKTDLKIEFRFFDNLCLTWVVA
ncbi:MAG TPA: 4'-phosphopantetheinyl transferase superfamily protein [Hanamia sp.]|nr:4'-phosphopantetheinyl transferase superfamily protein [Hanamia sp.]